MEEIKKPTVLQGEVKELWKDSPIQSKFYEVSNFGRVRSKERYVKNKQGKRKVPSQILKQHLDKKHYARVGFIVNSNTGKVRTVLVHRLVAKIFVPNPMPYQFNQVNHLDGNKSNNFYQNLEWCDNSHNQKHAYKTGLKGKTNIIDRAEIRTSYKLDNITQKELAKTYNTCQSNISNIVRGLYDN